MDTASYYDKIGKFVYTFQRVKWALAVLVRQMECDDRAGPPDAEGDIRQLIRQAVALFEQTATNEATKRQFHAVMKDLNQLGRRHDELLNRVVALTPEELDGYRCETDFMLQTLKDIATALDCDDEALAGELQAALSPRPARADSA